MMTTNHLHRRAQTYLNKLCLDIPDRRVGSIGNQVATDFFVEMITSFNFVTECPKFTCMDWEHGEVDLIVNSETFEVFPSPYSLGHKVKAPLVVASTIEELSNVDALDKILLLQGEIVKEQLMPKNFPFYNPAEHQKIYRLLEAKKPEAIIAATSRNPELAGGMYPFPLIEDGDFDIPSVYMTDKDGDLLRTHLGKKISLSIEAQRIPSKGYNVIALKGKDTDCRIVLCAHIDAKGGTPGALDNATGIVILLLLAELLQDYSGNLGLEIVALNGEDYYAASGEIQYVERMKDRWDEVFLAINMDGAGYHQGQTEYSLYECPDEILTIIKEVFSSQADFVEGQPWYQSDHSLFIQNGRAAVAITSDHFMELSTHITHTPEDHPDLVDIGKLINVAEVLRELIVALNSSA